jgi:hypothetical protein
MRQIQWFGILSALTTVTSAWLAGYGEWNWAFYSIGLAVVCAIWDNTARQGK